MSFPKQIFFLTFVLGLSSGWAAPHDLSPTTGGGAVEGLSDDEAENFEKVTISEVSDAGPKKRVSSDGYFYRYQSSLSPRVGYVWDPKATGSLYLFGFSYMVDSLTNRHWEIAADMFSSSKGLLQGGMRWILSPSNPFRPFVKAGLGLMIEPGDGLGNFLSFSHYQMRAGAGFEQLLRDPMSLRVELDVGAGPNAVNGALVVGYSWAW